MNASGKGAKLGEQFRHTGHFEGMTVDQYRVYGRTLAKREYTNVSKQNEFMKGWFAINQQFFCLLKDGPRRQILEVKLWCERCGGFETVEVQQGESVANLKYRPCPDCEKGNQ
jgi:hypothetical protein